MSTPSAAQGDQDIRKTGRRGLLLGSAGVAAAVAGLSAVATAAEAATRGPKPSHSPAVQGGQFVTTRDGTEIFYKDWGPRDAQPIVFHHGWPLSSDEPRA